MKHLGDITKIKGCNAPVVDCIIGGSPCQDLSVAGKRAGLAGERSGLYMEQIRIIKEMRHEDELRGRTGEFIRPRYMVWENVPGAFSSNKGKDFAAVIEEAIKVVEPETPDVPVPEKGWPTSGCIMGDSWSIAWRVLDAQFWGVPQRRRRIALVADFGGQSAPEILFIRKGVSRDLDESQQTRKATAGDASDRTGADDRDGVPYTLKIRSGCMGGGKGTLIQTDKSATLSTLQDQTLFQPVSIENHPADSRVDIDDSGKVQTLTSRMGTGGGNVSMVMEPMPFCKSSRPKSADDATVWKNCDVTNTLNTFDLGEVRANELVVVPVAHPIIAADQGGGKSGAHSYEGVSPTLTCTHGGEPAVAYSINHQGGNVEQIIEGKTGTLTAAMNSSGNNKLSVAYGIQGSMIGRADHNGPQGDGVNEDVSFTLNTTDRHAVVYGISPYHSNCMKSDNPTSGYYEADTARTLDALQCGYPGCNQGGMAVVEPAYYIGNGQVDQFGLSEKVGTLNCMHDQQAIVIDRAFFNNMNSNNVVRVRYIVRQLTPLECERLQGYPDGWTAIGEWIDSKGKKHKEADSPRYKALGNSIAIPPWKWVLKRICACYERDATMASLFDGIGGFPYIWEQLNGKGSCLWASEIEEFPMAVTKLRFGGGENG